MYIIQLVSKLYLVMCILYFYMPCICCTPYIYIYFYIPVFLPSSFAFCIGRYILCIGRRTSITDHQMPTVDAEVAVLKSMPGGRLGGQAVDWQTGGRVGTDGRSRCQAAWQMVRWIGGGWAGGRTSGHGREKPIPGGRAEDGRTGEQADGRAQTVGPTHPSLDNMKHIRVYVWGSRFKVLIHSLLIHVSSEANWSNP